MNPDPPSHDTGVSLQDVIVERDWYMALSIVAFVAFDVSRGE